MCFIFPNFLAIERTSESAPKDEQVEAKTPAKIEELGFTYPNIGDSQQLRMRR
jgi:hypothetical protein